MGAKACSGSTYHLPACGGTCGELDDGLPLTTGEGNTGLDADRLAWIERWAEGHKRTNAEQGFDYATLPFDCALDMVLELLAGCDALQEQLDAARQALADVMPWLVVPSDVPEQHWETLGRVRDDARAALGVEGRDV